MSQINSEMAGTLVEYKVKEGDDVSAGQEIAVMESMKMEVPVTSSVAGKVTKLNKAEGDFVNEGETLIELG